MSNEFLDYIDDILDAMQKAEMLVAEISVAEFEADFRINFAVMRALEIIGEATRHVPETVRDQYPDIPWKGMAGMRDRIIHGYDDVDLTIVWNVVQNDIPRIKPFLLQLLSDFAS
ncbi:MAG: DUF86 domain-containing protein [Chloroflexi bacterium]|nr:DUF86 domain-containing protein [Ardenticatenaceae bacterium]MBL1129569.1 DUF86 domain-containing protein [Chloroflexota bacterium]NOG35650.1 DUF86 domain-containing protein [Chloroflexota bacterium]GIK57001.1 MAG: DUF86 domain-containing protein [Chloroflexota bacterium]